MLSKLRPISRLFSRVQPIAFKPQPCMTQNSLFFKIQNARLFSEGEWQPKYPIDERVPRLATNRYRLSNIPMDVTEEQIREKFNPFGELKVVTLQESRVVPDTKVCYLVYEKA